MDISVKCPDDVIDGFLINKDKRKILFGDVAGGSGSRMPEEYQRSKIIEGTKIICPKSITRINLRTNVLKDICRPNINNDGFDYSEDFDGIQIIKNKKIYINLKCIVGSGGAQTRSLREVYWFIEGQLRVLIYKEDVYFANILDGDEAYKNMNKFEYLINLTEFDKIRNKIYVGDLKNYFKWFKDIFENELNI